MANDIKTIAYYLPQYHEIPENNKWWGKGFTEWVNVKNAVPLFEGHQQSKIPTNQNYYDLSDVEVMRWQAKIAKESGLYGFCFYHYWFYEKPLLEKPLLNYLKAGEIDFPYCFCWANESWTNGWAKAEASVIMEQKYGGKTEWKKHFDFLLPFFKDSRYIKESNKPLLVIYRPYLCEVMIDMLDYWHHLAIENGLDGIVLASQRFEDPKKNKEIYDCFDYHIEYQPGTERRNSVTKKTFSQTARGYIYDFILKHFNKDISIRQKVFGPVKVEYDEIWTKIINRHPKSDKAIAGAFVNWDNTPRYARRGSVFTGVTPEKFGHYMFLQIKHIKESYKIKYLFLFAWNEWGEGGYLEPDEYSGDAYLKALKNAVETAEVNSIC